jgi:hypothetical protein
MAKRRNVAGRRCNLVKGSEVFCIIVMHYSGKSAEEIAKRIRRTPDATRVLRNLVLRGQYTHLVLNNRWGKKLTILSLR